MQGGKIRKSGREILEIYASKDSFDEFLEKSVMMRYVNHNFQFEGLECWNIQIGLTWSNFSIHKNYEKERLESSGRN